MACAPRKTLQDGATFTEVAQTADAAPVWKVQILETHDGRSFMKFRGLSKGDLPIDDVLFDKLVYHTCKLRYVIHHRYPITQMVMTSVLVVLALGTLMLSCPDDRCDDTVNVPVILVASLLVLGLAMLLGSRGSEQFDLRIREMIQEELVAPFRRVGLSIAYEAFYPNKMIMGYVIRRLEEGAEDTPPTTQAAQLETCSPWVHIGGVHPMGVLYSLHEVPIDGDIDGDSINEKQEKIVRSLTKQQKEIIWGGIAPRYTGRMFSYTVCGTIVGALVWLEFFIVYLFVLKILANRRDAMDESDNSPALRGIAIMCGILLVTLFYAGYGWCKKQVAIQEWVRTELSDMMTERYGCKVEYSTHGWWGCRCIRLVPVDEERDNHGLC
mmetsp:Transcript_17915/g.49682  ORF Transcript_17915/g.49682 Transcript_17915/m.49682 type:complete len:382 (-) Transcript_17915:1176-2321(-)